MTVKFRDPLSARACVLVSYVLKPFIGKEADNGVNCRKCMDVSSLDEKSRPSCMQANSGTGGVEPATSSKEMATTLKRDGWTTSRNG